VYIAGPITLGDRAHNLKQAQEAHIELLQAGFSVCNPILTMEIPGCWDIPHAVWMEADLPWVKHAEAVLRLPGKSIGADEECVFAKNHNIPVFYSIAALIEGLTEYGTDDFRRSCGNNGQREKEELRPSYA